MNWIIFQAIVNHNGWTVSEIAELTKESTEAVMEIANTYFKVIWCELEKQHIICKGV